MLKDWEVKLKESIIPLLSDENFESLFVRMGQRICNIEDETEFRKQAEVFLHEYFEEFQKGRDAQEFCSKAYIEEIKVAL